MTPYYERDRYGAGMGQYSDIRREHWQTITFQAGVLVPLGQGVVIGGLWGIVAAICGIVVCNVATWPVKYGLLAGALAGAVLVAVQSTRSMLWVRDAYLSREEYTSEKSQGAAVEHSTMVVEWVEHDDAGNVKRMQRDVIPGTHEELAIVARQSELSKRILTRAGLGDDLALDVLAVLTSLRYIAKGRGNEASEWTSKGNAWRRALVGGGGGGGGGVVDIPTTTKNGVGG